MQIQKQIKKRSNEPIMKIIEKKFDSYPYEGSEEFEKLKKKTKELGDIALFEEAVERFIKEFEQRQDVFGPGIEKAILRDKFVTFLKKELSTIATKSAERDLKFLKEMRGYAETPTNLVDWEIVTTMIDDWIFELEALSKPKE